MHVQYGSGPFSAPAGWESFDSSLTLKWERIPVVGKIWTKNSQRYPQRTRIGDIVKGLPIPDGSCLGVFASHVLEHLALDEFHEALDNTRRLLREGGIFRMIVPDLEWAAREYIGRLTAGDSGANLFFLDETHLGYRKRANSLIGRAYEVLNTSKHLWMWDAASVTNALHEHGFRRVRRCEWGDCEDPLFAEVEDPGRFKNAVAIEARV